MFLDLDIVKRYNIIDDLGAEATAAEAPLVTLAMGSACAEVCNILQRTEADIIEEYGEVPSDIVMAALMLTALYYNNRDGEASQTPVRVRQMLAPYRRYPKNLPR